VPEIGLAGLPLDFPHSGSAVYARHLASLLPEVAPDMSFRLFLRNAAGSVKAPSERLTSPLARFNSGKGVGARADKLAWEVVSLPMVSAARGETLLHYLYFAAPPLAASPVVVTIHDLIPLVIPGYHRSRQSALYSRFMAITVKRCAAIVTVSYHSKRDIVRLLKVPEDRVFVTYEGADESFCPESGRGEVEALRDKYGLPERFLLYAGGAEKRKNLETLVGAWHRVVDKMREREMRLVIVADFPPSDRLYQDVPGLAEQLGIGGDVVFVSAVEEVNKPALYRAALGFCFPSTYEGFGLTPLEAMASGTPVIASNASSVPEVVGNAGWLVSPHDIDGWAERMLQLVDSSKDRSDLSRKGILRATQFCWRDTAKATADVYRGVLGR
jgi:glycosyltransferase involved in cell wall biosynthesis